MRWTGVCGVWKSSSHASSSLREAQTIPPPKWLDWAWDGMLTAKASLGMVLASGDMVAPQWHLKGVQGDEPREHPSLFPWASVWEWHQELLLDLLLGQDAVLWPLRMELSLLSLCSTSILSWQSQKPSVYGRQWAMSSQPL